MTVKIFLNKSNICIFKGKGRETTHCTQQRFYPKIKDDAELISKKLLDNEYLKDTCTTCMTELRQKTYYTKHILKRPDLVIFFTFSREKNQSIKTRKKLPTTENM